MPEVFINNISSFLPNKAVSNDEMEQVLGRVGEKPSRARKMILRSNGIKHRYYAIDPETGLPTHTNAQITAEAVRMLAQNTFGLDEIDCLACGTSLPDQLMPGHAVMTHGELGNPPCETISAGGVCVAGMSAMKYAFMGIASGEFQCAVSTGSENASAMMRGRNFKPELDHLIDNLAKQPEIAFEKDFLRWMLSDGAGAVLLQPQPNQKGLSLKVEWIFERSYANEQSACMYSGAAKEADGSLSGWKSFEPQELLQQSVMSIKQDVKQLNEHVIHYTVERPLAEIKETKGLNPEEIDFFLPHYSSGFFRDKVADGMRAVDFEIPTEKWFTNLTEKGNTGSASIYIMLDDLFKSGRLKHGDKILGYIPESGRFSSSFVLMTACIA